jgi:hypothetical protein
LHERGQRGGGDELTRAEHAARGTAEICAKILEGAKGERREGGRSEAVACHHNFCAQEVAKRGKEGGLFRFDDANAKTAIELLPHPPPMPQCQFPFKLIFIL